MKNLLCLLILLVLIPGCINCSSIEKKGITGEFFGLNAPGEDAELFAPGIISTGFHDDGGPQFTTEGDEVYYRIAQQPHSIIVFRKRIKNVWSEPEIVSFSGQYNDGVPVLSPDGKRIYFESYRPLLGKGEPRKDEDLWYVEKTFDGWGEANHVSISKEGFGEFGTSVSANGTLYFSADYDGKGLKIYQSPLVKGQHVSVELLNGKINEFDAACPCIAPDESFMVFTSMKIPGGYGLGDLFISFKEKSGEWGKPINLGNQVNSSGFDYFPSLSPDGNYLFFVSNRSTGWTYSKERKNYSEMVHLYSEPLNGKNDIYWVNASVLKKQNSR